MGAGLLLPTASSGGRRRCGQGRGPSLPTTRAELVGGVALGAGCRSPRQAAELASGAAMDAGSSSPWPVVEFARQHEKKSQNLRRRQFPGSDMESKPAGDDPSPLAAVASSFPLLVYDHGEPPEIRQTVLSVADESIRTFQVPEMCRYTCLETPQGLVLMVDTASFHCWLWNPQTGEKTALPAMDEELPLHCRCLVSGAAASSSPDPLVLVYDLERPRLLFCRARGGAAWATQSYDMGLEEVPGRPTTERTIGEMAAVKGVFYYLESRDVVGALAAVAAGGGDPEPCRLELATFGATLPTLDTGEELTTTVTKAYLLESAGELFLVCLFYLGCGMERVEEVGAYAMDFTKKEWVKVTDIGDAAFLLGHGGFAASCNAVEHGLKKGCVYFALDFLGDSNDYHIFDLKEGTREVAGPNQDIPTLPLKPFWLVPVLPQNYTLSALVQ